MQNACEKIIKSKARNDQSKSKSTSQKTKVRRHGFMNCHLCKTLYVLPENLMKKLHAMVRLLLFNTLSAKSNI